MKAPNFNANTTYTSNCKRHMQFASAVWWRIVFGERHLKAVILAVVAMVASGRVV